jgi:hypothetical protein
MLSGAAELCGAALSAAKPSRAFSDYRFTSRPIQAHTAIAGTLVKYPMTGWKFLAEKCFSQ